MPPKCVYHVPHDEQAPCSSYHPASLLFLAIFPESAALHFFTLLFFHNGLFSASYLPVSAVCRGWERSGWGLLRLSKGQRQFQGISKYWGRGRVKLSSLKIVCEQIRKKAEVYIGGKSCLSGMGVGRWAGWAINRFLCLAFWCYLRIDLKFKHVVWKN